MVDYAALLDRPEITPDPEWMRSLFQCRRILVTGAGGTIGSELCRLAAYHGASRVGLMERSENALFEIHRTMGAVGVPLLHDCTAPDTAARFEEFAPDVVFHTAAYKHVPMMEGMPVHAVRNNVLGTMNVLNAAVMGGASRFVFVSTDKAVNPTSIMGMSKRAAERLIWAYTRPIARTVVRLGNVLGSAGSVLDVWGRQAAAREPLTVTDRKATRYFITINEAAAVAAQAATNGDRGSGVYVPEMGCAVSMGTLAKRYAESRSGTVRTKASGLRPGEKLHEELAEHGDVAEATNHPSIRFYPCDEEPIDAGSAVMEFEHASGMNAEGSAVLALRRYGCAADSADTEKRPPLVAASV